MRLAVSAVSSTGKSTFVEDFLTMWPMYKSSGETYRALFNTKKGSFPINKKGTQEGQEKIMNTLLDSAMIYTNKNNVIHDRCTLDALAYTMWLAAKGKGGVTDDFVRKSIQLFKQSMNFYDIVFYIPYETTKDFVREERNTRETDDAYNTEVDSFFKAIWERYVMGDEGFFPFSTGGAPAFIEMFGTRQERIGIAQLYINPEGSFYGEADSILTGEAVQDFMEQVQMDKKAELDESIKKQR